MSKSSLPRRWKPGEPVDHRRLNEAQDRAVTELYFQPPLYGARVGNKITIRVVTQGGGGSVDIPKGDRQYLQFQMVSDTEYGWDGDRLSPPP